MNAACVSYCDMTSMDSYYSTSTAQGRDHQANPFRTFPNTETKYSPTFIPGKGQPYGEKPRSPFQPECQSLDGAEEGAFNKSYQLFMQRPSCKTPPEGGKLHPDSGLNGTLLSCYGECAPERHKRGDTSTLCWTEMHDTREHLQVIIGRIMVLRVIGCSSIWKLVSLCARSGEGREKAREEPSRVPINKI